MPMVIDPTIIRSNRKTLTLQVLPDATVVVKAPLRTSVQTITSFIQQHTDWIEEKLQVIQKRPRATGKTYKEGNTFFYLGREYILEFGRYRDIRLDGNRMLFPDILQFRIKKELTSWYIRQAKKIITEQVNLYAKQMKTSYNDLTFSDTSSQWGRCTHDNRLQFSWKLVMTPLLVINYVVVHELAHTIQKNHSAAFWSKVRLFNPSYRQQIKWLKEHGNSLMV